MNTQRYVVLRAKGNRDKVLGGIRGGAEAMKDVEVDVESATLSTKEVADAKRDPMLLRAAPVMPVTLIQPRASDGDGAAALAETDVTWGVSAVGAAATSFTGAGVTVAVLDTGIDAGHEAFAGKTIEQKDFTGDGDGDQNGHGTHCAGTI